MLVPYSLPSTFRLSSRAAEEVFRDAIPLPLLPPRASDRSRPLTRLLGSLPPLKFYTLPDSA